MTADQPPEGEETLRASVLRASLGLRERTHASAKIAYWVAVLVGAVALAWPAGSAALSAVALCLGFVSVALWVVGAVVGAPQHDLSVARLHGGGLTLHLGRDRYELLREDLSEGIVRQDPRGWQLRLRVRGGARYDLDLPDRETGERWLRALGLDAGRRAVRVVTDRVPLQVLFAFFFGGIFAWPASILLAILRLLVEHPSYSFTAALVSTLCNAHGYYFAARAVGRADVTVGVDGVLVRRALRSRFLSYRDLRGAELQGAGGRELVLGSGSRTERVIFATSADAASVRDRVEAAQAAWRSSPVPEFVRQWGDAPADASAWSERFVGAMRPGGYREATITEAEVEAVAVASGATPAQRAGALLALRAVRETDQGARVRVVLDAAVDPEARRVVERELAAQARRGAK